jgi:hypothetical protein
MWQMLVLKLFLTAVLMASVQSLYLLVLFLWSAQTAPVKRRFSVLLELVWFQAHSVLPFILALLVRRDVGTDLAE